MTEQSDPPEGFVPLFRSSPYIDLVGPFFFRDEVDGFLLGLRIVPKHANSRGTAHGGVLMTLLDIALGYRLAFSEQPPANIATVSLSADFAGAAKVGDWVEARVVVQKLGTRLAFANAYLTVNGEHIVRGSAVFARSPGALPSSGESPRDRAQE